MFKLYVRHVVICMIRFFFILINQAVFTFNRLTIVYGNKSGYFNSAISGHLDCTLSEMNFSFSTAGYNQYSDSFVLHKLFKSQQCNGYFYSNAQGSINMES